MTAATARPAPARVMVIPSRGFHHSQFSHAPTAAAATPTAMRPMIHGHLIDRPFSDAAMTDGYLLLGEGLPWTARIIPVAQWRSWMTA